MKITKKWIILYIFFKHFTYKFFFKYYFLSNFIYLNMKNGTDILEFEILNKLGEGAFGSI